MIIVVNDKMQKNYRYELTAREGRDFASDFNPALTPVQMLELGVFEGKYLNDCRREFPEVWFEKGQFAKGEPNPLLNCFKIKSRLSLPEWRRRGWIIRPDPRGWFQWYCRYYMGRRLPGVDDKQIKRWRAFRRHQAQVMKNCLPGDTLCRPRQRQALLQWAYNPFI